MRRHAILLLGLAIGMAALPGFSGASARPSPPCDHWLTSRYQGDDPRMRLESVGGRSVFVLVPPGYDDSTERYPVIYLIHGGVGDHNAFPTATDVIDFTAGQPAGRRAIVVMPDGTVAPTWSDWRNDALRDESLFIGELVPFVDGKYRTISGRAHRAIAGISGGGLGAALLAARHPDMFAAFAGFSALLNVDPERPMTGAGGAALVYGAGTLFGYCYDDLSKVDPFGMFGDPLLEPVWIRDGNPQELAENYRGLDVTIYAANGQPCDSVDLNTMLLGSTDTGPDAAPWPFVESGVRIQARDFSDALDAADVPNTLDEIGCGLHTYRYFEKELHLWWDRALGAFGSSPPLSFDFRDAEKAFSVWGWTFEVDPKRAPEFLDVTDASGSGVTLTGSGVASVMTASVFEAGQVVTLSNAVEPSVVADSLGRITFHVDLGPAHEFQQYTLPARALEALSGYWTTKSVTFASEG